MPVSLSSEKLRGQERRGESPGDTGGGEVGWQQRDS